MYDFILFNVFINIPSIIAIYMGSRVTSRGNQFAVYVGKYANQCDDEVSCRKVKKLGVNRNYGCFALQINLLLLKATGSRKPILNCGFFNIDLTLGFSIVATIATYIVIITQFEKDYGVQT